MTFFVEPTPPQLALPPTPERQPAVYWRPNAEFIEELANFLRNKRVLEIFAGNGYLAAWLNRSGVPVRATTRFSGHDGHSYGLYAPVEALGALEAVERYGLQSDVLLVCWPTVTPVVLSAARRWGTEKPIVFIGEVADAENQLLGGCATDEFFKAVVREHEFHTYRGNILEAAFVCRLRAETLASDLCP